MSHTQLKHKIQIDRQIDSQTERSKHKHEACECGDVLCQINRQTDKRTEKQKDRRTDRQKGRRTNMKCASVVTHLPHAQSRG